jgi:hypothetical protein
VLKFRERRADEETVLARSLHETEVGRGLADCSALFPTGATLTLSARRLSGMLCTACALGGAGFFVIPAGVSQANIVNLGACNSAALSQPFAPWGDPSSYELAPEGDFESSSWTLSNGASIVPGSEPFAATGSLGQSSLSVPAGEWAVSPQTCVDAAYPTLRLFVGGTGTAAVSVIYQGSVIPVGVVAAGGSWTPSAPLVTGSAIAGAFNNGSAQVSIAVTGLTGNPQVDDVFIDPWHRG